MKPINASLDVNVTFKKIKFYSFITLFYDKRFALELHN